MAQADEHETAARRDAAADSDLDPAAFLKSVRELSEKREREDQERFRKLEEEVQKGREERAARRAERARSISPDKQQSPSPTRPLSRIVHAHTPNASRFSSPSIATAPAPPLSPSRQSPTRTPTASMEPEKISAPEEVDVPEFKGFGSIKRSSAASTSSSATSHRDSASISTPSASNLARSGTLSWQQRPSRPTSKLGASRPTSVVSDAKPTHERNVSTDEIGLSREQIAESLGARDPSWFKQTAERGNGSAAYRKSKDETPSTDHVVSGRRGLPGMSRETSTEHESLGSPHTSESTTSDSFTKRNSVRESVFSAGSSRDSATSISSRKPDLKSLIAEDEDQQKNSPSADQSSITSGDSGSVSRTLTMSSSQARLTNASERPASPTKGVGGFVQSAMMKRSDSQTKRWSGQPGGSPSRNNSVAGTRSGLGGIPGSRSMPKLEPAPLLRQARDTSSRPTSSSNDLPSLDTKAGQDNEGSVKSSRHHHSRSKSIASNYSTNDDPTGTLSPGSPSKRFSPTKSSWVESAISRPESPTKPAPTSRNSQPSWMADLAKAKAQRASTEVTSLDSPQKNIDGTGSRPGSPTKTTPFGQSLLKRSDSRDLDLNASANRFKPTRIADKFTASPAGLGALTPRAPSPTKTLDDPIDLRTSNETSRPEAKSSELDKPTPVTSPLFGADQPDLEPDPQVVRQASPSNGRESVMVEPKTTRPSKSPTLQSPSVKQDKAKPDTPPKPSSTDFRSQLKSRPRPESKPKEEPEFLSKFGNLRKTQQERYVEPDVLKDNILRGKSGLTSTGGPVKTERKDELKESLVAKKEDMQKAKQERRDLPGQAHERKISQVPLAPSKPEALAKRELLGRSESAQNAAPVEKATPEGLSRYKSLQSKPVTEAPSKDTPLPAQAESGFQPLTKQMSEPIHDEKQEVQEKSKLAARFNPGLAGLLARGPPSNPVSRPESPATPGLAAFQSPASEPPTAGEPLQDVRKDRAKGPKRRKGAQKSAATPSEPAESANVADTNPRTIVDLEQQTAKSADDSTYGSSSQSALQSEGGASVPLTKSRPSAAPGSAASVMLASLGNSPSVGPFSPKPLLQKPSTPAQSPALSSALSGRRALNPETPPNRERSPGAVPAFKGFGAPRPSQSPSRPEENKENSQSSLPSVKLAAGRWGQSSSSPRTDAASPRSPIELPTRKDEEAAMRSAGLLSSSPKKSGLGITVDKTRDQSSPSTPTGLPPKPAKSSRIVSGQLAEASPNKGLTGTSPTIDATVTTTGRLLIGSLGIIPKYREPLAIDTQTVLSVEESVPDDGKTVRKTVNLVLADGTCKPLPPPGEYTHFDQSTYLCTHAFTNSKGTRGSQIYLWAGSRASESTIEAAQIVARKLSKENGSAVVQSIQQGLETTAFLRSMGGIFVTRRGRGDRPTADKQYMLCGRKHLGHIVFDEVDFAIGSLCTGFVYLVSHPVTLQETKLYLWKGSSCSTEELSAARLAAMDLSETGEIIEVDSGAEFPSFLKIFGQNKTKGDVRQQSEIWQQKSKAPDKFKARLFRIRQAEAKTGLFTALWNRRPSWNSLSPARSPAREQLEEIKVEAKEISPFIQEQLEADGIYLLDGHSQLYLFMGPLFASHPERVRDTVFGQALLFASNYATMSASLEDRRAIPKCEFLFSGVPHDVKMLFRHWDESRGFWGTAGLMAGSSSMSPLFNKKEVKLVPLDEVLTEVCRD